MLHEKFHCPGNISCFFEICESGSTGCGINTDRGVLTKVSDGDGIYINGEESDAPTSSRVLEHFPEAHVRVEHKTEVPVSYGFGTSGAGALSLSIALDLFLDKNLDPRECIRIAHTSEVECKTGLGDVVAIANSDGIGLKTKPGLEGLKPENRIRINPSKYVVCALFEGMLKTKSVLKNPQLSKKIKECGAYCTKELASKPTKKNLLKLSRWFTKETGLWNKEIKEVMEKIPDTSMIMLGNGVYCLTDEPEKKADLLAKFSENIITCRVVVSGT